MEALKVLVVRHGGTAFSAERRFTGTRDVPLDADGHRRADALARALAGGAVSAVYASPLERTRATAEAIAKAHRLDVAIDPAFRDMGFGAWEGLTRDQVAERFPSEWATWRSAPHRAAIQGGEPLGAVAARVAGRVAALQHAHGGSAIVLVAHAIVIRIIVLAALGLEIERLWSVDASPGGLTELEYAGDWVTVHRMNTVAHLDPGASAAEPPGSP